MNSYRIDTSEDTYVWESKEMTTTDVTMDADGVVTYTDTEALAESIPRYYRVFAINSAGTGLAPFEDYVRATGIAPTIPSTTQDLMATVAGYDQINLSWSAPSNDGHTDITKYCISVSRPGTPFVPFTTTNCGTDTGITGADGVNPTLSTINDGLVDTTNIIANIIVVAADDDSVGQSYQHKMLTEKTRYQYRVTAVNSRGSATIHSNMAFATTGSMPSGTTTTASDAVRNLRAVVTVG